MNRTLPPLVLAVIVLTATATAGGARGEHLAHAARSAVRLTRIGTFDQPLYLDAPPGDASRLFVVERPGRIRIVRRGRVLRRPFLDIADRVSLGGERGLLSMAFAPDYARSGLFYVDYTDRSGNTNVVEYRRSRDLDRASPRSRRLVLFQRQPEPNHNGGLIVFGPDGLLYAGLGDGGGGGDEHGRLGNAQNLRTLLGKILRIDPRRAGRHRYRIPARNPFARRRGIRREIFAYGLRNPWRFSFDARTGDMAIGDVGENRIEEVDFARAGRTGGVNYGWRVFEGRSRFGSGGARRAVSPVLQYTHAHGCSVTGGYVVRDPRLPALNSRYVYADYCVGRLFSVLLRPGHARRNHALGPTVPRLTSFGQDARRRIYLTSARGPVYRLDPR